MLIKQTKKTKVVSDLAELGIELARPAPRPK